MTRYKTAPSAENNMNSIDLDSGIGATPNMGSDKGVSGTRHCESTPASSGDKVREKGVSLESRSA